tara:strand:- start:225 stop:458 length:234 start_codon:yes stop_codon:yes gene_type:complete
MYNPPNTHYTQFDVSYKSYDEMTKIMGKNGKYFKEMTQDLGLDYIWWDKPRMVIEIWGRFESLKNVPDPVNYIEKYC